LIGKGCSAENSGSKGYQTTGAHRLRHGEAGQPHDADALQRQLQLRVALVDGEPARDLDFADLSVDTEGPTVQMGALARQDAGVAQQLFRPRRPAVAGEIVG